MEFIPTKIPEVILVRPNVFSDVRGFFMETFRFDLFMKAGINPSFVQDNHSGSQQGVLRGLHYQIHQEQGKLVQVISGEIYDVVVDLRRSSSTFGKWVSTNLSATDKLQLWIPPGFAHGYYVTSEWAEVTYKVTDYYAPEWERSLLWNDPALGIPWPLVQSGSPTLSAKDAQGQPLSGSELFE
jgi:dTDP-4-dehydrorhamnose 3,5-epimerase